MLAPDPVLTRFRAALDVLYGNRIERLVLYGSRARGDSRPDSDYDVAIFLNGLTDRWEEIDKIVDIEVDIIDDLGAVIHARPYQAGSYMEQTPLMHEIRREGVDF
jgi:predicted nucleotidyltransferase